MEYEIKSIGKIPAKLRAVKSIKELTGLGLKDSKEILDHLSHQVGNFKMVDVSLSGSDFKNHVDILEDNNIILGDSREDKLDDLSLIYRVDMISPRITYKIFEGSVKILDGVVIINIISATVLDPTNVTYGYRRDLVNTKIQIDFSNCIVEEPQ